MTPPSVEQQTVSTFTALLDIAKAIVRLDVEGLATALAVFTTARQAIRTVATGVAGAAMQGTMNAVAAKYQDVPLTPAVLADMAIRNIGENFDKVQEAAYNGIDEERFNLLVEDTGESYGVDQALSLWWRGKFLGADYGIDEAELDKVIYYSRVRDQFIPDLKLLAQRTMSPADAINAVVKGRLTEDEGKVYFQAAGGMIDQWDALYQSSGDSVGVSHAVELHAHGMITDAELQDVIYQSRINPRFYDIALMANAKWLPPYQIEKAVAAGVIDPATAMQWLIEQGYPEDQAVAFAATGGNGTIAKPKAETEAMILDDFEAQIITEDEATGALKSLGYKADAIPFILDYLVAKRVITMRNAAVTRLREAFVNRDMTEAQVTPELVALGIPTAAIDQMMTAWTIEQMTHIKRLSAAQVGKLVEDGVLTTPDALARWVQMGYDPVDAQLLLSIYAPGSKAPPNAQITANPLILPADGKSTSDLVVQVNSTPANPAPTGPADIVLTATSGTIGPVTQTSADMYHAVYVAGTTVGEATIGGTIDGKPIGLGATISLTAPVAGA